MVAIHFTGNFATFNILTVLLMIPVWADDDGVVARWAHTPGSSSKSSKSSSSSSSSTGASDETRGDSRRKQSVCGLWQCVMVVWTACVRFLRIVATIVGRTTATMVTVMITVLGLFFMLRICEEGGISYVEESTARDRETRRQRETRD